MNSRKKLCEMTQEELDAISVFDMLKPDEEHERYLKNKVRREEELRYKYRYDIWWDNFCFALGLIFAAFLFVYLAMDQFLFVYEHGFVPDGYIFDILLTFIGSFAAGWILYGAMEDREQFFNMSGLAILVYIAYSIFS